MKKWGLFDDEDVRGLRRRPQALGNKVALIASGAYADRLFTELQQRNVDVTDLFVNQEGLEGTVVKTFSNQIDLYQLMRESEASYFITAYCDVVIGKRIINAYQDHLWNVHPSLLPEFRGPDPVTDMLDAGMEYGAVTVHVIDEGKDTGPVLGQRRFRFKGRSPQRNYRDVIPAQAAELISDLVDYPARLLPTPQKYMVGRNEIEQIGR